MKVPISRESALRIQLRRKLGVMVRFPPYKQNEGGSDENEESWKAGYRCAAVDLIEYLRRNGAAQAKLGAK